MTTIERVAWALLVSSPWYETWEDRELLKYVGITKNTALRCKTQGIVVFDRFINTHAH